MKQTKLVTLLIFAIIRVSAQEPISLKQIVERSLAVNKSIQVEKTGIEIAQSRLVNVKEARLPEASVSGQFMYLPFAPKVDLKFQQASTGNSENPNGQAAAMPVPHTLALGQLNISYPVFTGFKLKNSVKKAEYGVELSEVSGEMQKEIVALQTINLYYGIYKTNEAIKVLDDNLARSESRIKDFQNFVNNGIMSENDLLKAKLQKSNLELSIEEAKNNLANLNFRLNTLLQQDIHSVLKFENQEVEVVIPTFSDDYSGRKDISILSKKAELSKIDIEMARSAYYPTIALAGGYVAAGIQNFLTISNAVNLGVAVKYNISSLYKNKSEIKTAQISYLQAQQRLSEAEDKAKIELSEARNNYDLSLKKQKVYKAALDQATENFRIVVNKNKNGLADTDQLLEADVQLLQAQINQRLGAVDSRLAMYQVIYSSGQLLNYFK